MRRILEQFPPGRGKPVMLNLPLARPWGGFFHGDLMAKAIDHGELVYQVAYESDEVICEGWYPADWVVRWSLDADPELVDNVVPLPDRAANWPPE